MSEATDCPFCLREFKDRIISENEFIVSFLSNLQLARGHALVVPKRHVAPPDTLTDDEKLAVMHEVERLRARMLDGLGKGVDVWQKSRPYVPQGFNGTKVDHIHFHVLPCNPGSELYDKGIVWTRDRFTEPSTQDIEEMLAILRP